ncbi:hypothetical protein BDQ17DRAFT_802290 [Cyathus striatus]|nr:hypothetical protein BDQ17DRAFT_802290 [Cyathus striatus]
MYIGVGSQNGYPSESQQINCRNDIFSQASSSPSAIGVSWENPGLTEFSRSRSPSTSSQSSHEHLPSEAVAHPSLPLGRVQGFFATASGSRSLPQLLATNGLHKFTAIRSPPATSPGIVSSSYAISNPDSESSLEEFSSPSQYDPCFEALRIR